ncbi:hypothetical protein ACJVC5_19525 [Peredibacter sp. HCB2-198]
MAKTVALFFVLGLMVSCASHHNDRGISSVEDQKMDQRSQYYDRVYPR